MESCLLHLHSTQLHFNNRGQLTRNRLAEGIHKLLMIVGEKCAEVVGALWINLGDQALWPSPWGLLYIPSFRVLPGPHGCPWRPHPPHPPISPSMLGFLGGPTRVRDGSKRGFRSPRTRVPDGQKPRILGGSGHPAPGSPDFQAESWLKQSALFYIF